VSRLAPSPDVLVSHLEGEAVLLHMGTKRYFRLNRTGAHIWKALEGGADSDAIARSLVEEFEVSISEAEVAVRTLVEELVESRLLREA
jgi:hypothetical protein